MADRILCTCGCGLVVTYATKRNHLNARGKTLLRARVVTEVNSLNGTQQQQKPTSSLQRGFKKRASSNPDQDGSRKRRKAAQLEENQLPNQNGSRKQREAAQLEENQLPEFTAVDTEDFPPPVATDTDRQSKFVERSRGVMDMRWLTSRRDGGSHSDGSDDDEDEDQDKEDKDGDEEAKNGEDKDKDEEDKDEEENEDKGENEDEEDKEDKDEDDEDEDEPPFYDSEIPGISNWDLLGEDFEREAAALGLYFSYELPTQLTTL
jgi:hypothetical protein